MRRPRLSNYYFNYRNNPWDFQERAKGICPRDYLKLLLLGEVPPYYLVNCFSWNTAGSFGLNFHKYRSQDTQVLTQQDREFIEWCLQPVIRDAPSKDSHSKRERY